MRKILTLFAGTLISGSLLAGGLVTNTNQSASWVRMPARNASTEIDAAYFNPAGMMKLNNGFHLSLSNQSIFQTREIENFYTGPSGAFGLNENLYTGTVTALAFPSIYAVYKMDKLAFSLGFNPIGGGGGALYEKGLPSFEMSPSDLVPSLAGAPYNATAYRLDAYFKGSSTFLGFQGGLAYKINDWLSVAAGVRYVTAKNTYEGHLKDIQVNIASGWTRADVIMTGIAGSATTAATSTSAIIAANATYGGLTLAQAEGFGIINAGQRAQLEGGLTAFGSPTTVTISQADAVFKGAAGRYTATATLLGDQTAKAAQSGSGITPVFSVNISPSDNLNIAIKYEMATKLELENETTTDLLVGFTATGTPITMFPNGGLTRNDMPAMLSVGFEYKVTPELKISAGSNYFFDKTADYGHKVDHDLNSSTPSVHIANSEIIESNGITFSAGLEYALSENLLVSGGYAYGNLGVNEKYQSDLTFANATSTVGFGGAYLINENMKINLGFGYTAYQKNEKMVDHIFSGLNANIPARETYKKGTAIIGVGLDLRF
jgi:long-subunit fatty acid transport protein